MRLSPARSSSPRLAIVVDLVLAVVQRVLTPRGAARSKPAPRAASRRTRTPARCRSRRRDATAGVT